MDYTQEEPLYSGVRERNNEPSIEEIIDLDKAFQEKCPTGYEKVAEYYAGSEPELKPIGFFPRNVYQYNGIKLSPAIVAMVRSLKPIPDPFHEGKFMPDVPYFATISGRNFIKGKGLIEWTESEVEAIAQLADENEYFAFHQLEV